MVERCDACDQKVMDSIWSGLSSPELSFFAGFFSVFFPPLCYLSSMYVKDPSHSTSSAPGRLQLNAQIPLTHQSWNGLTMLSRHSVGTHHGKRVHMRLIREHSSTVITAHCATVD